MVDKLSKLERSRNMSAIKSKNTSIELVIRKELHKKGFRYRLHNKDMPGKPDLVLSKYKAVIFVHGCFWHGHEGCKIARTPKSNVDFWVQKITRNQERDKLHINTLVASGWRVLTVWECALKGSQKLPLDTVILDIEDWILGDDLISEFRGAV